MKNKKELSVTMYRGKPVLCLNPEIEPAFMRTSFGLGKCKTILENMDKIQQFVEKYGNGEKSKQKTKLFKLNDKISYNRKQGKITFIENEGITAQFGKEKMYISKKEFNKIKKIK